MRGALRGPLPALPGGPASHREVLPRVRDTGGAGGVRISPARAAVTGTRRRVPRRAPPAHGALLRPGRLDAALAAVRRRGVARPHRAIPAGRLRAVGRFGGHVARKLGDGLLIYFGWPTAREDDPERAVRAGLAIVDAMGPLNGTLAAADGPRLAVRIGLHTGPVV